MRKILLILAAIAVHVSVFAQDVTVTAKDRQKVEQMLKSAAAQPRDTNWMMYFARQFFGVPYVGGTLDKADDERLVVNLRELDCTTYVETVLALSLCASESETTFGDYCRHLREVRYADGEVAYTKRQHYFTVWIEENARQDIVKKVEPLKLSAPFSAVQTVSVDYMTTHVSSYKMLSQHPEWKAGIREMERSISGRKFLYIPKSALKPTAANNKLLRQYIEDGDIIAILTSKKGLDTTHIGIASWHKDGLHLINASSVHKKVVDEPMTFYDYMQKHPSQTGIRVVRMKQQKKK